jgi:hypothetical protein
MSHRMYTEPIGRMNREIPDELDEQQDAKLDSLRERDMAEDGLAAEMERLRGVSELPGYWELPEGDRQWLLSEVQSTGDYAESVMNYLVVKLMLQDADEAIAYLGSELSHDRP